MAMERTQHLTGQLLRHAPFTGLAALSALAVFALTRWGPVPLSFWETAFWLAHPAHVLMSAMATTVIYRSSSKGTALRTMAVGYAGSVGIATLSDCAIPYLGEWLLRLPERAIHLGFIEKWWLVNPMAVLGVALAWWLPETRLPHAGHVFVSTWASLFHITMAAGGAVPGSLLASITGFLFLAVWLPCCTSDIVFPLLAAGTPAAAWGKSAKQAAQDSANDHTCHM
jgi:hypothetical protein